MTEEREEGRNAQASLGVSYCRECPIARGTLRPHCPSLRVAMGAAKKPRWKRVKKWREENVTTDGIWWGYETL